MVFKSLGCMYLGQRQSSKLNYGFRHGLASIRIFLMWSGMFPVATQCKLAREKGSFLKKEKNSRNGHLAKFYRLKIGAPERNKCSPGLPIHHQLPELTQTHVHWVSDAIQPSLPLSSLSPPAFNLSSPVVLPNIKMNLPQVWILQ